MTTLQISGHRPSRESVLQEVPIVVEYPIGSMGHIRFYLAPRFEDEEIEGRT